MQRIHFLQHCCNLADPAREQALYGSSTRRRFVGIANVLRHETPTRRGQPQRTGAQRGRHGDQCARHRKHVPADKVKRAENRTKSTVRSKVEPLLSVVKPLRGCTKVRYRGLVKNANPAFTALALANIYLALGRLTGEVPVVSQLRAESPVLGLKGP